MRCCYLMNASIPLDKVALLESERKGATHEFLFFWGHQKSKDGTLTRSCFSQWWHSPFSVDGRLFATAEHYMMVRKAELFGDAASAQLILSARTPKDAKALGRTVRGFSDELWLANRDEIVFTGNWHKFSQNPALKQVLLKTANAILVEASPVDAIWGIGLAEDHPKARQPADWPGLNLLGFALMKVREKLQAA